MPVLVLVLSSALTWTVAGRSSRFAGADARASRFHSWTCHCLRLRRMARSGSRSIAAGAPRVILQKMSNERVPVLRIPGHRSAPKQEGHGGTALLLDARSDNTDELRQRLFMGELQL
jgi:hypothetical protein